MRASAFALAALCLVLAPAAGASAYPGDPGYPDDPNYSVNPDYSSTPGYGDDYGYSGYSRYPGYSNYPDYSGEAARPAARPEPGLNQAVLAEINYVRAHPAAFAQKLRRYRQEFRGRLVYDGYSQRMTNEGVAAVDEAIAFLERQRPLPALSASSPLAHAAADHVYDQGARGSIGHISSSGQTPAQRMRRYGSTAGVTAETIAYGETTAEGVVRAFIVDDGVRDRGHRADVFDGYLRFAGVACGSHRVYRAMCVVDFSGPLLTTR
jgi:uncharacterized protein YkwD